MLELLEEARAAKVIPWTPRDLRYNTCLYPCMAEWLKDGEGDRLMAAFKTKMDRLDRPPSKLRLTGARFGELRLSSAI